MINGPRVTPLCAPPHPRRATHPGGVSVVKAPAKPRNTPKPSSGNDFTCLLRCRVCDTRTRAHTHTHAHARTHAHTSRAPICWLKLESVGLEAMYWPLYGLPAQGLAHFVLGGLAYYVFP